MNKDVGTAGFFYPSIFSKNNKQVKEAFECGEIDYAELTQWNFVDEFFCFILKTGFLKYADSTYPNPREKNSVPIWFLISTQFVLRIYTGKYHQLKHLLNSGSILTRLGFNIANINCEGFNNKNKNDRKVVADTDSIRRFFKDTRPDELRRWFNTDLQSWFKSKRAYLNEGLFILDQSHLVVPDNPRYEKAVKMPVDEFGQWYRGYKKLSIEQKKAHPLHSCYTFSSLLHANDSEDHFHIAGYEYGPGNEDELVQARKLIFNHCDRFPGVMKELIVDRGYIDGSLISKLKNNYNVDVLIPLKSNMDTYKDAVSIAKRTDKWELTEHVLKKNGELKKETKSVLVENIELWDQCPIKLNIYVSYTKRWSNSRQKYDEYYWVLASSKNYKSTKKAIERYALRFQIEERFRQLKTSWEINKFSSPAEGLIEAHLCFISLTYSMLQLYFRKNDLRKEAHQMLSTLRQGEKTGKDAVIVYADGKFGVLDLDYCFVTIAGLEDGPRKKISEIMTRQMEARKKREQ